MVIDCERMSVKNIELYKRVLEAESKKGDAAIDSTFKRINNLGVRYQHDGANPNSHDMHGQQ